LDKVAQRTGRRRIVAIAENPSAHGADYAVGIRVAGKDHASGGLQSANAMHHPQAVAAVTALSGQHHVKGGGAEERLGFASAKSVLDGAILPLEDAPQDLMDGTVGIDNQ
jgi:hypothetical protein